MSDAPTREMLKQIINLICKGRKPNTKFVYTRAFRASALEIMCDYVRQAPAHALKDQLEDLFVQYEDGIRRGATSNAHN